MQVKGHTQMASVNSWCIAYTNYTSVGSVVIDPVRIWKPSNSLVSFRASRRPDGNRELMRKLTLKGKADPGRLTGSPYIQGIKEQVVCSKPHGVCFILWSPPCLSEVSAWAGAQIPSVTCGGLREHGSSKADCDNEL